MRRDSKWIFHALACAFVIAAAPLYAGLRHHWRLDETSGLTASELASGNDGTLVNFEENDDSQWVPAQFDGGLNLAAGVTPDNYFQATVPAMSATASGGFTIMLWVNPSDTILGSPGEYQLFSSPGDSVGFTIYNNVVEGETFDRVLLIWDGSLPEIIVSEQTLEPGNWYHVAMTSTGPGGEKRIFIDGNEEPIRLLVPAQGGTGTGVSDGWPAGVVEFGAIGAAGRVHGSQIDDVRIYDEALNAAAIQAVINNPPPAAPSITVVQPNDGDSFYDFSDGIRFDVKAPAGGAVNASDIHLTLNGDDVTASLVITGNAALRTASYNGLQAEKTYAALIEVRSGAVVVARKRLNFGTLTQATEPGLRHHWKLDETSGLNAADTAGGAIATLTNFDNNDDAQWVAGKRNGALDLGADATLNNFAVADVPALDAISTGGYTIALWLNPGNATLSPGEYQLVNTPNDGVGVTIFNNTIDGNSRERVLLLWDGSLAEIIVSKQSLEPGLWYHVAVTSAGPGGAKKIFIDGAEEPLTFLVPSAGGIGLGVSPGWQAGPLQIGGFAGAQRTHDSLIDDVRVYEVELAPEEIADLAGNPSARPSITNLNPPPGTAFHNAADGLKFDVVANAPGATIPTANVKLTLNGADVSGALVFSGTPASRGVTYGGLVSDKAYDAFIDVTDSLGGVTRKHFTFSTLVAGGEPGLRHHWRFDETSGLVALDTAGGSNASLVNFELNDDSQWTPGVVSGACDFGVDGTFNNYATASTVALSAADTGGFTVAMWILPGQSILNQGEFQLISLPGDSIGLTIFNATIQGNLRERRLLFWDGSLPECIVSEQSIEPGLWYHVAITSAGPGGEKKIYINGEEEPLTLVVPQLGGTGIGNSNGWGDGVIEIGGIGGAGRTHDTAFDDVRVYEFALGPEDIRDLVPNQPPRPPVIANLSPENGNFFQSVASGLTFDANAVGDGVTIAASDIHLTLNGVDVSGGLSIGGTASSRHVSYGALVANTFYTGLIGVTGSNGLQTQLDISFGTFPRSVESGLRHHWKLDEPSGLLALDSASGANAELVGFELNDDSQWVPGQVAGALNLGADTTQNNYLRSTLPAMSAAATGGFSFALWIRPGDAITRKGEYQLLNAPGNAVNFSIQNNTSEGVLRERVLYLNDGSIPRARVGTTKLEPGTWYHVAFTSTGAAGERRLYVNGAIEATEAWQPSQGGEDAGTADGWGAGAAAIVGFVTGRRHNSTVDDIRIYESALSPERIAQLASGEPPTGGFHRGDADQNGTLQLTDAIQILGYLFLGTATRVPECLDAADADDNGIIQLTDAIRILSFLFLGGLPPAPPGPPTDPCGTDGTDDGLDCLGYGGCA